MTDPTANQSGQGQGTPPAPPGQLTAEQLEALKPFQSQLTWVASQQHAAGRAQGEKELTERLGMTVDQAVAALAQASQGQQGQQQQGQQGQGQAQGQQGQQQPSFNPDLERRIIQLEETSKKLNEREAELSQRELALKTQEQDGIRVAALKSLGMTDEQAAAAKAMMPLPPGVTEMTPELAKASADQLKSTFPTLFVPPAGGENGGQQSTGGPPPDTHTRGTQTASTGGGSGQSAQERAKARLIARGHAKPASS